MTLSAKSAARIEQLRRVAARDFVHSTVQAAVEQIAGLTPEQQVLVDNAFLGAQDRVEMASYLLRGIEVVIFEHHESGDSPPFAVAPKEAQDFWLGVGIALSLQPLELSHSAYRSSPKRITENPVSKSFEIKLGFGEQRNRKCT